MSGAFPRQVTVTQTCLPPKDGFGALWCGTALPRIWLIETGSLQARLVLSSLRSSCLSPLSADTPVASLCLTVFSEVKEDFFWVYYQMKCL